MCFDFTAVVAPFRMQPGLRRMLAGATQLTPNRPGSGHLAAKLAVLTQTAGEALLSVPGFDPAPGLTVVLQQAAREHPEAMAWDADRGLQARWLGWTVAADGTVSGGGPPAIGDCLRALPAASRLPALLCLAVEEDLAIIDGATGVIPWLAVCLPSRWSPRQKIGRHFAEVHADVADNRLLLAAGPALARLVSGPDRWERFVWTLTPQAALDAHPDRGLAPAWPDDASADGRAERAGAAAALASAAWFRTEHQTFIPLPPAAQQAVFTIRVGVRPLSEVAEAPDHARRLHDALASMSRAVLDYRGLTPARERLLAWLQARAG